jgi:hypothetical protein
MPPPLSSRRRKWILLAVFISTMNTQLGCIRFRNDAPPPDAAITPDAEIDAETPADAADDVVIPPPVCSRFGPNVAANIATDLIALLVSDCALRRHFAHLPPAGVGHFRECLTAQIGQVMGCRQHNGEPFKYPVEYAPGRFCRDMKSSHAMFSLSGGDFDAFIADMNTALDLAALTDDEKKRVLDVFRATRNDIVPVQLRDAAAPTAPCDTPDAN